MGATDERFSDRPPRCLVSEMSQRIDYISGTGATLRSDITNMLISAIMEATALQPRC